MTTRRTLLALSAALLAGCGPRAAGAGRLRVGSQKGGTKALMLASGVLDGAPYQVEWSEFPAAQHLLEAVGAGAVDLGAAGDAPFLFAYASGGKVRAVHAAKAVSGGASTALLVKAGSAIRSSADLRGRKIATGRGSIGHYLVLALLDEVGLKPSDVEFIFLSPADAKAAFSTGAVDAWSTWNAYVYIALQDGDARILRDGQGLLNAVGFEVANLESIAVRRAEITDFLGRLSRAQRWALTHKAEWAAALAKETGLAPDIALKSIATSGSQPVPIDAAIIAQEAKVLARFQAAGAIGAAPDLAAGFDPSFNSAVAGA